MTRDETKMLVLSIVSLYPNWHPEDLTFTVNTWAVMLADENLTEMQMALKKFVLLDRKGFAPSIGQLKDQLYSLASAETDESEYRRLIVNALRDGIYHSKDSWDKFPEELKRAIQPQEIKAYAMQEDLNIEYLMANIIKRVEAVKQREKELSILPERLKSMIEQTQNRMLEAK